MAGDSIAGVIAGQQHPFQPAQGVYSEVGRGHYIRMGAIVLVACAQMTLFLQSIVNSPILPGNWAPLQTGMEVDLLYTFLALGLIGALPLYSPALARGLRVQPGGIPAFLRVLPFAALLGWVVTILLIGHGGTGGLNPTQQLQTVVILAFFVAPSEELFFRVAVSNYFRNPLVGGAASSAFFGVAHIWSYSSGGQLGFPLVAQILFAMILGFGLWAAYRKFGYGASVGLHAGYDVAVAGIGALTSLTILGVHFGPI